MKRVHASERRIEAVRQTSEMPRFQRPLVLVVDDNEDNRELFALAVEGFGYRAALAVDGLDALERAKAERPDVVLMDLAMPRMDGFEATRAMREVPELASVPIIAVTAFTDAVSAQRALAAGCDEVLLKPITPEKLTQRIEAHVHAGAVMRGVEAG